MHAEMPAERAHTSLSEDEPKTLSCVAWSGISKRVPVLLFCPEAIISEDPAIHSIGEKYNLGFKIVRTESRLVRGLLTSHGFHEVHLNSTDFNLMWSGSHLKPHLLRSLQNFQKVNHFPRSYELTRKDKLYKNIQRMQQSYGFHNFNVVPQAFVLPGEYQEFSSFFSKERAAWIIKPVASSRGRGIYLVNSISQIPLDENVLVSRYINNPLLIDDFKFDLRLYVLVTSYDPLVIYLYEEGLARFATVKYSHATANISNQFMHLTNYSVNKKSSDYVSCDDPEVEDYGNKWSMSAMLRYLKQEGKDTTLLMGQIEDLIIKAILSAEIHIATACKMYVPHRYNCFELYGFDVLIDSNFKPWLLEVNLSPSLACDAPLDLKIKASMISDMFSLVGFVCQDPSLRQLRTACDPRPRSAIHRPQSQRPETGNIAGEQALKETTASKPMESTLSLSAEEMKVLRRVQEEYDRRGGFIRIFPTHDTWEFYSGFLEYKTTMNAMLASQLFQRCMKQGNNNVPLVVGGINTINFVQYERKLLTLEARRRRRSKSRRTTRRQQKIGFSMSTSLQLNENEDGLKTETEIKSSELERNTEKPTVNLLLILQQGWNLSKVQARMAFSLYLQQVQMRLLIESRATWSSAWTQRDTDQMELVFRFLKRASSNLGHDICLEEPHSSMCLQQRQRVLSQQLGSFIRVYNKETKEMVETFEKIPEEPQCINSTVFQEFILEASESDLEEVLTYYTQKNKSAGVFLGTKCATSQNSSDVSSDNACINTGASGVFKNPCTSSNRRETDEIGCNSQSISATYGLIRSKDHSGDCSVIEVPEDSSLTIQTEDLCSTTHRNSETMSKPTVEFQQIIQQTASAPNSPSYLQPPSHPLAHTSSHTIQYQPFDPTFIQRSSRPSSAGQGKPRHGSAGTVRQAPDSISQPQCLSTLTPCNQQAIVSALRKLLEKQSSRQYSSSSHIGLLTHTLNNLNLTNGFFSKGGSTLSMTPDIRPGPLRAVHSDVTAENSGYQLQFAIQQLQQQKLKTRKILDYSQSRHKALAQPDKQLWCPHTQTSQQCTGTLNGTQNHHKNTS
ncbi:hypothetical protein DNTS_023743 [Danionella cerebrum]|uniref:Tubulin--tyrosine ligase-like protein 5 n=1 Tax=Danionella cerebrum TaxID=2873325 RepID=A0A553QP77_9TELE|nr:hypothetical protein DNTS_023743 [Danionella translucida]